MRVTSTLVVPSGQVDGGLGKQGPHCFLVVGHAGNHQRGPSVTILGVEVYTLNSTENVDNFLSAPGMLVRQVRRRQLCPLSHLIIAAWRGVIPLVSALLTSTLFWFSFFTEISIVCLHYSSFLIFTSAALFTISRGE